METSRFKITIIVNNIVFKHKDLWAEEGVSFLIQTPYPNSKNILFDVGRSGTVAMHNLSILGHDTNKIDYIIISHAHLGHFGGLVKLLDVTQNATIILNPYCYRQKYKRKNESIFKIEQQSILNNLSEKHNVMHIDKQLEIASSVYISGELPFESVNDDRYLLKSKSTGEFFQDNFTEEQVIFIDSHIGIVIISACSHHDIIKIIKYAKETFNKDVYAVIGGTHFMGSFQKEKLFVQYAKENDIKKLHLGHCSGILNDDYINIMETGDIFLYGQKKH